MTQSIYESAYTVRKPFKFQNPTLKSAVAEYMIRRWALVPLEPKSKQPSIKFWQSGLRTVEDINALLQLESNLGVVLGEVSGGLVDIDLDCPEALSIADRFLPATSMIFGRDSTPRSHWLYLVSGSGRSHRLKDPETGGTLIEYRANGAQTMVPPSVHPEGETVRFDRDDQPGDAIREELIGAVKKIAAVSVLVRRWTEGSRHALALALAGGLAWSGVPQDEAEHIVETVCIAADDNEVEDRLSAVATSYEQHSTHNKVTGWPTLEDKLSKKVVRKLKEWLGSNFPAPVDPILDRQLQMFQELGLAANDNAEIKNQATMAQIFAERYQHRARYCHQHKAWYLWDGARWAKDDTHQVLHLIEQCVRDALSAIPQEFNSKNVQDLTNHFGRYLNWKPLNDLASLAGMHCAISPTEFDSDPFLLNVANGTLDLRTGELREHDENDFITHQLDVDYDPDAWADKFTAFLSEIMGGDQDLADYVQRVIGYSLTGDTREECLFVLHGSGANGKTTLINAIRSLLGSYSTQAQAKSFMENKSQGARNDIARLAGTRFVSVSESEDAEKLAEGLVKQLTGNDTMVARFLYQEEFEFRPTFKLLLATNKRPAIQGTDEGIWRRIHLIPFEVTIPEDRRDRQLADKLEGERAGILAWAVRGCLEWQQRNALDRPKKVLDAVQQYRTESDVLGQFLEDCVSRSNSKAFSTSKDLHHAYGDWAIENGFDEIKQTTLGKLLKERGFKGGKKNGKRGFYGLNIAPWVETAEPSFPKYVPSEEPPIIEPD